MSTMADTNIRQNIKCFIACGIIMMSPFQYGLDFGLIGGLQAMPGFLMIFGHRAPHLKSGWNITPARQQLISSLMTLGAFITSATAGFAASKLSRRQCLWLAAVTCCVANVIMMTTTHIGALYVGRFVIGCANGYFMTFSQLYIQESSPAKYRGLFLSGFQFCTSFGTLIGTVVDNETAPILNRNAYLIPLGVIYVLPFILSIAMIFIPESPRWLLTHGNEEAARKSLTWLRPNAEIVEHELAEMKAALEIEKSYSHGRSFMQLFNNPIDRRRTFLSVAAVSTQAASGAMFMIAYKTYFLQMAGVAQPFLYTVIQSVAGCVAILINSCIIARYGRRRRFLTTGLTICGLAQLCVAVVYNKNPGTIATGRATVGLSTIYLVTYNGTIASYAWLAGGEIPSQRLRSYTFGLAAAIGFAGAWLATFTAPYFINPDSLGWGPKYGYIWFPSCIVTALWVFMFLPETKGRTLEQINEMFEKRLPARKFASYVSTSVLDRAAQKEKAESFVEDIAEDEKVPAKIGVTTA